MASLTPAELGRAGAEARHQQRLSRIEDYQFIGGPRLSNRLAAQRLGLSKRTIERYRATLKETAGG